MRSITGPGNSIFTLLVTIGVIMATWGFEFAYDDFWQIVRNNQIIAARPVPDALSAIMLAPTAPGNLYRPLALLTYRLEHLLAGLNPASFHFTNALLYALVCALVLQLYQSLLRDRAAALFGALIFAAHPLHVEVFANIVGRAEILAALFGLAALLLLINAERGRAGLRYALAAVMCLCALLSKETAAGLIVCVPFFLCAPELNWSARRNALFAAALGAAAYLALRVNVLGSTAFIGDAMALGPIPENPIGHLSFSHRLIPALAIWGSYLRLFILPWPLSADYSLMPRDFILQIFSTYGAVNLAIFLLLGALAWHFRPCRWGPLGILAVLGFLPSCNVLFPIGTLMAERLSFIPSIGYCGFMVGVLGAVLPSSRINQVVLACIAALYLYISAGRVPVWQNNRTLFSATAANAPLSPKAAFNWGVELQKAGLFAEAENSFRHTLELNPHYLPAMRALAEMLILQGRPGRTEYWLRRILEQSPNDVGAQQALAALQELKTPVPAGDTKDSAAHSIKSKQRPASH